MARLNAEIEKFALDPAANVLAELQKTPTYKLITELQKNPSYKLAESLKKQHQDIFNPRRSPLDLPDEDA